MRGVTTTMIALARKARGRGQSYWPIPLDKIEEIAEHLRRVDRLVVAVESFSACAGERPEGSVWTEDEVEGLGYLRDALREVQS